MKYRILMLLITLTLSAGLWAASAQDFVSDGLIGFWPLDASSINGDVAEDVIGGNDGTIMGDPGVVAGKIGQALEFDGVDDYVELPDMGNEPAVTVEAWALAHSMPPDAHSCCIGIVSSAPDDQWKAGTVHFKFEAGLITVHKNDSDKIAFSGAELDTWYHAAYTCDTDANEFMFYVNGEFVGQLVAGETANNLTHVRIASEHEGRYLPGIVDEVRIYTRALSANEIRQNFEVTSNSLAVKPVGKLAAAWGSIKSHR
jgi:hypothetical protein